MAAVLKDADAYQHIDPALVGNQQRVLVSELSGRGNVLSKAREFGLELDRDDPADAPARAAPQGARAPRLLVRGRRRVVRAAAAPPAARTTRRRGAWSTSRRMVRKHGSAVQAEATVKVEVGDDVFHTAASGNGPVNALDAALRKALIPRFPALKGVRLLDYKVRILDGRPGTARDHAGADRVGQGVEAMVDGRVLEQHHRGVAGGPGRLAGVRIASADRSSRPARAKPRAREIPEPLRRDVRLLGGLLGQVIAEQGGDDLLRDVERLRRLVIAARRSAATSADGGATGRRRGRSSAPSRSRGRSRATSTWRTWPKSITGSACCASATSGPEPLPESLAATMRRCSQETRTPVGFRRC